MKQCILKVIALLTHFWRTLKEHVCGKKNKQHIYVEDVDSDGIPEVILDINGYHEKEKEVNKYDNKSNETNCKNE